MAGAIGSLLRIPGVSSFVDIVKAVAEIRGWLHHLRANLKRDTDGLQTTADELKKFLLKVGIQKWGRYWHYGRQLISLQHRLFVEQVYSDLGGEWGKFVTGFGPIEKGRVSITGKDAKKFGADRLGEGAFARRLDARNKQRYRGGGGF